MRSARQMRAKYAPRAATVSHIRTAPAGTARARQTRMPYANNGDLPPRIRTLLPKHAQDIYRAAFNDAFERYGPAREDIAHRIAWSAVKRRYVKRAPGFWERRASAG